MKKLLSCLLGALFAGVTGSALDLPRGQIIDDVACNDDPAQHYSLYLPSKFTTHRMWPIILAFDAGGPAPQGRRPLPALARPHRHILARSNKAKKRASKQR